MSAPRVVHSPFPTGCSAIDEPAQAGDLSRHACLFVALVLMVVLVAALSCVASGVH